MPWVTGSDEPRDRLHLNSHERPSSQACYIQFAAGTRWGPGAAPIAACLAVHDGDARRNAEALHAGLSASVTAATVRNLNLRPSFQP